MVAKETRTGSAGTGVRRNRHGKPQEVRTSGKRWSKKAEKDFLETLAASANVTAAAAAAGFSTVAIYNRRKLWPGFRAAWDAALDQGYARIEALLIENAGTTLAGIAVETERPVPPMTIDQAMNLLRLHRAAVKGGPAQRYDARARPIDLDKVRASILAKAEAILRHDARKAARGGGPGA